MTNKEKVIAAFLVSVGVFSSMQAVQYVRSLSQKEKNVLAVVANGPSNNIVLCQGVESVTNSDTNIKNS